MSEKVVILSDSTSDLSQELIDKYDIKIIPLKVGLGEQQYIDGVNVDPEMIYAHYEKTGELPKTAAVNILEFADALRQYTADGSSALIFTIGSQMSSTFNNACLAAEDFENVYVIDTQNLSTGGGLLILAAAEMAEKGMSAADIAKECELLVPRVDASFVIDDLEFLYKGGRCSALAALGANALKLKPCIAVRGGKMGATKKYRGRFGDVLKKYVADQIGDASDIVTDHVFVTHAGCDESIYMACYEQVKAYGVFKEVHLTRAGCTISSHCGRNTLGVLFIRKNDIK
ncbi:MAG: DegV family protein [Ruminococcaceae bacterium]|nr:DegV family protein [Oscillospiraceae bacterium]